MKWSLGIMDHAESQIDSSRSLEEEEAPVVGNHAEVRHALKTRLRLSSIIITNVII